MLTLRRCVVGAALVLLVSGVASAQTLPSLPPEVSSAFPIEGDPNRKPESIDAIVFDESHCLLGSEMITDPDPMSCYCRDAIADGRYVYFTYLLSAKDRNLNGVFFSLSSRIRDSCGDDDDVVTAATDREWKWNGPDRRLPAVK